MDSHERPAQGQDPDVAPVCPQHLHDLASYCRERLDEQECWFGYERMKRALRAMHEEGSPTYEQLFRALIDEAGL
jgi:hypothetical protein